MKKLLLFLALTGILAASSLSDQQKRCDDILWRLQQHYGLTNIYSSLTVTTPDKMKDTGVWGDAWGDEKGWHIEIMDLEDFPKNMPRSEAVKHQNDVVMHEFLHLLLTTLRVPSEEQDTLIYGLQPNLWH